MLTPVTLSNRSAEASVHRRTMVRLMTILKTGWERFTRSARHTTPHLGRPDKPDNDMTFLSPEDGRKMFDEAARKYVGMSGEEFLERYRAGALPDPDRPYDPGLHTMLGMIGFAKG